MPSPHHLEVSGHITILPGKGGLQEIQIHSDRSTASIYLHGAHVTHFQKNGEAPLLFMSEASEFRNNHPIRGGVPVIFPWFGPRVDSAIHGTARVAEWELLETKVLPDSSILLHFRLPSNDPCKVDYRVTVGSSLTLELTVSNTGGANATFENCLHSYFQVGDIRQVGITGLLGTRYHDMLAAEDRIETDEIIRITSEVDRTYQNTASTVEIHDPTLHRTIRVRKSNSKSTVLWNPWIAKSQRMPDFGDDEYFQMLCVESGNIAENAITLAPGESSSMIVEIDSVPIP
ncbi:MAG: D-hexose-6-phosphate mutarotase [Verrucomicrobiota bacterium]